MVVIFFDEMDQDVFDAVSGLGIEKIKGVMGGWEVTVHTVRHKPLGIVHVGGGLPCVVGETDLVAGGAKLRGGGADHGVIGDAEDREGQDKADADIDDRLEESFQERSGVLAPGAGWVHDAPLRSSKGFLFHRQAPLL
jgi:hypothetical protein